MSFRLGDKLYKEILYGYAEDLTTGDPLYVVTQLTDGNVEISAESVEMKDKNGNLVKKIWKGKTGTFSATNAFVNMNLVSAASGNTPIMAAENNTVEMPKMKRVKAGTKVALGDYVEGTVKVAQYFGDGSIGKVYSSGVTASETEFSVDDSNKQLTLPTDESVDEYFVKYIEKSKTGVKISNLADKFPESVRFYIKATYYNPCKKNELKADYIEFPSFQISPEVKLPINAESATMDFSGDLEVDYCGVEKVLYNIFDADEVDE